jgi:hypothetical protein
LVELRRLKCSLIVDSATLNVELEDHNIGQDRIRSYEYGGVSEDLLTDQ